MMLRTISCGVCGESQTELRSGEGWPQWGQLMGVVLDGDQNPYLCPVHLASTADHIDALKENLNGVD